MLIPLKCKIGAIQTMYYYLRVYFEQSMLNARNHIWNKNESYRYCTLRENILFCMNEFDITTNDFTNIFYT
jgi:hypothetical protein